MQLDAAIHLLEHWFTAWEEQQLESLMYTRPMTSREYRSGNRESPRYIWLPADLERVEWAMTSLGSHTPIAVKVLGGVHLRGWSRGRAYDRAVRQFIAEWDMWETIREEMCNPI